MGERDWGEAKSVLCREIDRLRGGGVERERDRERETKSIFLREVERLRTKSERERERELKESWRQRGKRQNVYFLERQTDREVGEGRQRGGGAWRHRLLERRRGRRDGGGGRIGFKGVSTARRRQRGHGYRRRVVRYYLPVLGNHTILYHVHAPLKKENCVEKSL